MIDSMLKTLQDSGKYDLQDLIKLSSVYWAFIAMQNNGLIPKDIYKTYGEILKEL